MTISRMFNRKRTALAAIEALAALAVMAVLLAFVGQWSAAVMHHRRAIARRHAALHAMDNVATIAMAMRFPDLSEETLTRLAEPHAPKRSQWDIRVQSQPIVGTSLMRKKVVVGVAFDDDRAAAIRPRVTWKYPESGEETR